jgi:UDP-N-acetylglucosamine acyltransferase
MPIAQSARIHPTALISPEADLGEDVQVGAFVVVEGAVQIGAGCVLRPGCHLFGPLTMGRDNQVHSHAVLGGPPQHLKYAGEATRVEIGDSNIFRESVTVHRATTASWVTRIGHNNFFMANSHVAHDCQVGDRCVMANNSALGGHCVLGDGVFMAGQSAIQQFVRVGRLAMLGGLSGATRDIPPFVIQQHINRVAGVNVVGMRRGGVPTASIDAVRRAFHILYHRGLLVPEALDQIEREVGGAPEVRELVAFIRASTRGIILHTERAAA